jgi:O-antigen/teichoic acid export membrane protein
MFINNLLLFAMQKIPQAVIGKLTNPAQLGVFTLSRDVTYATTTAIVLPINRAAFPGYSKLNGNTAALKNSFLSTLSMIALIIIPAGAGISAIAPLMVPLILGSQWLSSIPVMQILAFSGLFFAMANVNSVYLALAKPYLMTRITLVRLCIYLPCMIYGTLHFGIIGTSWSLLITGILILPVAYYPAARLLDISLKNFFSILYRPALAALLMYAIVATAVQHMSPEQTFATQSLWFIVLIFSGAVIYPVSVSLLWLLARKPESAEFHILQLAQRKISRFSSNR